ncbi:MAG: hypothetical protein K1X53_01000 [Candidatus Sumerlaeaceae bacterium]|nr:hypothetical protein [Candidatus Sumerlaeaceae bacterium]
MTVVSNGVFQTDFYGTQTPRVYDTTWGDFEITLAPDPDPLPLFLQLYIRSGPTGDPMWAIQNMCLPASNTLDSTVTISRFFDLGLIGVTSGTDCTTMEIDVEIVPLSLTSASPGPFMPVTVGTRVYNVSGSGTDNNTTPTAPTDPGTPPAPDNATTVPMVAPTKILRTDVPDVEEGVNECGPGAVTRSILWLKNKGYIDAPVTTSGLMGDFKTSSSWDAAKGVPTYADFLKGKLAVTKDLDVNNKFMVRRPSSVPAGDFETSDGKALDNGNDPTFEFIKKEIKANEDVEIYVGWLDAAGVRFNGHVMTVVGVTDDPTSKIKEITVQDDRDQNSPNAKNQRRSTRYTDGSPPGLDDIPTSNRVELVVSESARPRVTTGSVSTNQTIVVQFNSGMGGGVLDPTNFGLSGSGQGTLNGTPDSVTDLGGNQFQLTWTTGSMAFGGDIVVEVQPGATDADGNPIGQFNTLTLPGAGLPVKLSQYLIE